MPEVRKIADQAERLFDELDNLPMARRVEAINRIRKALHAHSPFAGEPVDCVQWVPGETVEGNDYNPNTVAPPEMKLLELSIRADGYTQPIVVCEEPKGRRVVVDGFHRKRIGKKAGVVRDRLSGYLPVVAIRSDRTRPADRIAATIRHNRARGVHSVMPMTEVVVALLKAGWSDLEVAQHLGMDDEEVLRFKQVSGLPELFKAHDYSRSWD